MVQAQVSTRDQTDKEMEELISDISLFHQADMKKLQLVAKGIDEELTQLKDELEKKTNSEQALKLLVEQNKKKIDEQERNIEEKTENLRLLDTEIKKQKKVIDKLEEDAKEREVANFDENDDIAGDSGLYDLRLIFSTEYKGYLIRSHEFIHNSVSLIDYKNRRYFYADMRKNDNFDVVTFTTSPKLLWLKGKIEYYVRPKNQNSLNIPIVSTPTPIAYEIDMANRTFSTELSVEIDGAIELSGRVGVLNLFKLDAVLVKFPS